MTEKTLSVYYEWLIEAIEQIETYTDGMSIEDFDLDQRTIDACLMQLQHIGETAKKMKKEFPQIINLPLKEMSGLRDIISHDYQMINIELIWNTIKISLPDLKKRIISHDIKKDTMDFVENLFDKEEGTL